MNSLGNSNLKTNITRGLKTIELLKCELVDGISSLFKAMIPNQEKKIINALVRIIISVYLLARRLGISFDRIDQEMNEEIQELIDDQHEVEEWFGDLSSLQKHIQKHNF